MQDAPKAVWSIPYVSLAFFPSLKHNFIAYDSSKVSSHPDCIFEIHQALVGVYSNCCCSCSFEAEILKIGQSSHKMYSNNILNFQEPRTILNACTKKSGNLLNSPHMWCHYVLSKLVIWCHYWVRECASHMMSQCHPWTVPCDIIIPMSEVAMWCYCDMK